MIRTLIVEDDVHVADVHRAYVERVPGFAVVGVAHRGVEALELVADRRPDLVLLDFHLPDAGGLQVCRAIHARAAHPVDVIAVTAARDADTVRAAVSQGVLQYLIKPFSFATFQDKLERYAAYHGAVGRREERSQAQVDELFGTLRGSATQALPKGLARETLDLVAATLRAAGDERSATEVADAAGLSRVTARRYLEHLAAEGRVSLSMRYGGSGRPEHRYRWSGSAGES